LERNQLRQIARRDLIQIGALGTVGLSLPQLYRAAEGSQATARAKRCLIFFMEGGPAHQDMWDMKPQAPANIRGPFAAVSSTVPGLQVCEHMPLLSQQMHRVSLLRAVHHTVVDHNAGTYYALTGRSPVTGGGLIVRDEPENFPPVGSVISHLRPTRDLPEFVHMPEIMFNNGNEIPGERAGFLGAACNPLVTGDPSIRQFRVPGLSFAADSSLNRMRNRQQLLAKLDQLGSADSSDILMNNLDQHYQKAFRLLGADRTRRAFDLQQEPHTLRARYGFPDREDRSVEARKFGGLPHLGQCLLLARRLLESGVQLVTCCTGRRIDQTWDGHRQHFSLLKKSILPYFDQAFSAFLQDLDERGMLDDTLVVAMGEFGRTPRIGQVTSSAGATAEGRDHWPHCYTVLMAGAGINRGGVYGRSDNEAAFPVSNAVTPEDIAATIYHALGLDPESLIHDQLQRPHKLALGNPILDLFT
jgi:hypothetical protein